MCEDHQLSGRDFGCNHRGVLRGNFATRRSIGAALTQTGWPANRDNSPKSLSPRSETFSSLVGSFGLESRPDLAARALPNAKPPKGHGIDTDPALRTISALS